MGQQDAFALGRSNLNTFLFADIGVDGNGLPLSVLSALARQGLDPWDEAERLARLPRRAAADGLARLIAALPASLWPLPEATVAASRLVALLPGHSDAPTPLSALMRAPAGRPAGPWLIAAVLFMVLMAVLTAFVARAPAGPEGVSPVELVPHAAVPTSD